MLSRFHVPEKLAPGQTAVLPDAAAHHAAKVLRLAAGDEVVLFDGSSGQWRARLIRRGKTLCAELLEFDPQEREAPLQITLAQALPAADKMDWIVQKSVELGVAAIVPLTARRSVLRLDSERRARRRDHWQQIAIHACEQCQRNRVPPVAALADLPHYLAATFTESASTGARWALTPNAPTRLSTLAPPDGTLTLLVGPEGGFEDNEMQALDVAGFMQVSLGPRVLRAETAGVAALAAVQALWGDF